MKYIRSSLFSIGLLTLNILFASSAFSITIISPPNAQLAITVSFTAVDYGDPTKTSFSWAINDVAIDATNSDTFSKSFGTLGVTKVSVTATDDLNVSQTTFFDIDIVATAAEVIPQAVISILTAPVTGSNPNIPAFYANDVVDFQVAAVSANVPIFNLAGIANQRFLWYFGDPASNDKNLPNLNIQATPHDRVTPASASYIYKFPGTYTVTLVTQDNYIPGELNALSGLTTMDIEILEPLVPPTPVAIQQIYVDRCLTCHGSNGTNGVQKPIAGRGPNAIVNGLPIAADQIVSANLILQAYTLYKRMELSKPVLSLTEAEEMATYLASLPAQEAIVVVPSGEESYRTRCSICHGRGIGGYASNIMPANIGPMTQQIIADASAANLVMRNITIPDLEMTALLDFINTTPVDADGALIPQPAEGSSLYTMYCAYCHGDNGLGGAIADFPIRGVGTSASQIIEAIQDDDEMQTLDNQQILPLGDIQLIADTL